MKKSQKRAIAVGAGVATLAAAAGAVYMLTGKNAKNRKKVSAWAGKMQKDVVAQLKKAKKGSQAEYNKVVDSVAKNYKAIKKVDSAELALVAAQLKDHWTSISKELKGAANNVRRITPKVRKSVSRKVKVAVKKVSAKKRSRK